ncbi:MFS transporter [Cryptosporangium aurantiacum]|uniref:Fucose permease n=1 Tax=Cryptosporangium aurantiacum TaxID=134849 RepID=A0A1M7IZH0_9ACTN|nr:MFS transporter [Cryptosporangium aurantiacum]SHM46073.1 Fucose permease [Cryptosporangium aurantiacum]
MHPVDTTAAALAPTGVARPDRAARRARIATLYTFGANGALYGAWVPWIPEIKADLRLSAGVLGFALLGVAIGSMVSLPLGGAAAVRFGSPRAIRAAFVATCVLAVLPGLASNGVTLFVVLFVWGLAVAACDVTMNVQAVTVERRYGRSVLSGFHAMLSLGALVGAALGSLGAAFSMPVSLHLGLVAAVLLAGWLPMSRWFVPDSVDEDAQADAKAPPLFARPSGRLLVFGAVGFIVLSSEGAVADWSGVYLRENLAVDVGAASLGFVAFSGTMTIGRLLGDRVLTRFGSRRTLQWLCALAALGLGGGLLSGNPIGTVAGFAVLGLGLSCTFPALVSTAGSGSAHPGASIAAVTTCGYVGFLVGPPGIGALTELVGLRLSLGVLPVLLVVALALVALSVPHRTTARGRRAS